MEYSTNISFYFKNQPVLWKQLMQRAVVLFTLLFTMPLLAEQCPQTLDGDSDLSGWSLVNMTELHYPATFISARYITSFGVMNGLVLCDYVDQNQMPFYLMSTDYYADPNPNRSKRSLWIPKTYPFSYLLCTQSAQDCEF